MFETVSTVVGTVVTDPIRRRASSGDEVISFRVASNSRRFDKATSTWVDGQTLYLTVSCWRHLVTGVGLAVEKGRPIIVHGSISTNEYVGADDARRSDLQMTASAVGLDLARCVVSYRGTPAYTPPADTSNSNSNSNSTSTREAVTASTDRPAA
ncbi:MAG: single-stranded DNA-binding protein [Gordonia sp. (in: high G+C Gram-positive bacteria)]